MEKYKQKFKESDRYLYPKEDYYKGLPFLKSMLITIYQDFDGPIDASKSSIFIDKPEVEVDGLVFCSTIKSKQNFRLEVKNKRVLTGTIFIIAKSGQQNVISIKGMLGPDDFEVAFK